MTFLYILYINPFQQIVVHHAHRRTSSGPQLLAVPHSPGESPTPHDHFPDTTETKSEYDHLSEHPIKLPKQHSRSPSLSAGIVITSPTETEKEANQVRERRKSLQINASLLSSTLNQFDQNNNGYLKNEIFQRALLQMNINIDLNDNNIKLILKDISDNGKGVNISKLINFVCEQHSTLKLESCKQWNSFRMKIISVKRKEGFLRILYKYDAWPQSLIIDIKNEISTKSNSISIDDINKMITKYSKDNDASYKEMKYCIRCIKGQKIKWINLNKKKKIPLYVADDGWLEINIWLKTQKFMTKNVGKPIPKN